MGIGLKLRSLQTCTLTMYTGNGESAEGIHIYIVHAFGNLEPLFVLHKRSAEPLNAGPRGHGFDLTSWLRVHLRFVDGCFHNIQLSDP